MTDKIIARYIKDLEGFTGKAKLYELSGPVLDRYDQSTKFVVVSATVVPFSGAETYIFPSDSNGKPANWLEMDGSYRGGLSHVVALENAGYIVIE